jgi:hypothetical protein
MCVSFTTITIVLIGLFFTHLIGGLPWLARLWVGISKVDMTLTLVSFSLSGRVHAIPLANDIFHLQHQCQRV